MTELDELRSRVTELEAALHASYEALAALGDPLFAETFEASRVPEVARLRRRVRRLRGRNERLTAELERLRSSRTHRWSAAARGVLGRVRRRLGR
jgi:hypothetical protein